MIRKFLLITSASLLLFSSWLRADEGMWLLNLLEGNVEEMKRLGLELTSEQIYSLNNSSLKDAVGALDMGSCSSELVSAEGLLLTNHHCGYDEIQSHSTIEHDYLKNGFWAMTREQELPNPGKTVTFLIRIEDVTDQVLPNLKSRGGFELEAEIEAVSKPIIAKATEGTDYEGEVKSFFDNNKYYLLVTVTYKDVRLVGAPPESIGKFGHDTDNWMWPRHTGDFSVFRVYTGPDGKPSEYSPSNIPLKPKKFFPVSIRGFEEGDYSMTLGYPGGTDRYMTSFEVKEKLSIEHPVRIKVREAIQGIMLEDMQASEEVRIQYSSKYSKSSNYWKNSIGQIQGLNRLNVVPRKEAQQAEFVNWMSQDQERTSKYSDALKLVEQGINGRKDVETARQYIFEAMYIGMESVSRAYKFIKFYQVLAETDDTDSVKRMAARLKKEMEGFYKDYNLPTERRINKAMLTIMKDNMPGVFMPDVFKTIDSKHKGSIDRYLDNFYKKSIFPYREKMNAFLDKPNPSVLAKDPAFLAAISMLNSLRLYYVAAEEHDTRISEGRKKWMAALMEMQPDKKFYPDANSTLRLSYGKVSDYKPRDAVWYDYETTLSGVMEKEDPDNYEFVVPEKLKELYKNKDFGRYSVNDTMNVCFISDNDITGGNSGSPVLNSRGELIGIAFDGNWEAMSGDIIFEPELQKCISVDIRYVLFVMDKFAGARHLVEEMEIVE